VIWLGRAFLIAGRLMLANPIGLAVAAIAGAAYKEIARDCNVSLSTVRNQLHAIYTKLGVSNKTALAKALAGQGQL